MDKMTTIEELKNISKQFCEERDWDKFHNPKELAIAMSTEANELLQIFRFKSEKEMTELMASERRTDVSDELADVLFCVLRFAQMNNIDLSNALKSKMEKNVKKYPVEKVRGSNKKYTEYKD